MFPTLWPDALEVERGLCSILKTSLELALSGRLELDLFVTHPICDAARNLAAVWGRNKADRLQRGVTMVKSEGAVN